MINEVEKPDYFTKMKWAAITLAVTSSYTIHNGKVWRVTSKKREGFNIVYGLVRTRTSENTFVVRTPLLVKLIDYIRRLLWA